MSAKRVSVLMWAVTVLALCIYNGALWAQEPLTVKIMSNGLLQISRGEVPIGTIELNAHGPGWKHAPQNTATGEIADLGEAGKRVTGTLPVPNTEGGAIQFTETVRPVAKGLQLEYEVSITKAMRLNGLQLSLNLPVAVYKGKEVLLIHPEADMRTVTLPEEQPENFMLWGGEAARIEIARDAAEAIALEMRAAADVVIQDLRQWEHQIFEIRLPAIMEDQGRDVTPDDKFHLDVTISFATPIKLIGP